MMVNELRRCPFCGCYNIKEFIEESGVANTQRWVYLFCALCLARTRGVVVTGMQQPCGEDRENLAKQWNQRHDFNPPQSTPNE